MQNKIDALSNYITSHPSDQNAIDIFKGDWSSKLPDTRETLEAGPALLFEDERLSWAIEQFEGVAGKRILELGPLEGGHSYMLEKAGASEIVSIEANVRAFLKCLITKELYHLKNVTFKCGDFLHFLRNTDQQFDVGIACGVLYHMLNPVELIALLAGKVQQVFIWTHYHDPEVVQRNPVMARRFRRTSTCSFNGLNVTGYCQDYNDALKWSGFCGGSAESSVWLTREDILKCVEHFGFRITGVSFETKDHQNGPCFAFTAERVA
jgi:hypothetical protein